MTSATVLYCTNLDTPLSEIRDVAQVTAETDQYLAVLVHAELPTLPINVHGVLPYSGPGDTQNWTRALEDAKTGLRDHVAAIQTALKDAQCPGDVRPILCADADVQSAVAQSAKFADVATLATSLRQAPTVMNEMVHGILFQSPIGLFLNTQAASLKSRILVGWNDSLAASRAVHAALPLLKAADDVVIACFDPSPLSDGQPYEPGAALAVWLGHHGCKVDLLQRPGGGKEIALATTDLAREVGADLVVAGAYSHSRMRQALFGGTTRSLLAQTEQAVFLAH